MRIPIVCHGDETTTRGKVVAFSATIHDDHRKIALHGDQATCGNCKGLWNIVGTGEGMGENGRLAVINGDHVLCPCGRNRVIASPDAGMFIHLDSGVGGMGASGSANAARTNGAANHWISFALKERGNCGGLRCVAYFDDGSKEYGTFCADNTVRFERFDNGTACSHLELLPGDNVSATGSVTESLLSVITG